MYNETLRQHPRRRPTKGQRRAHRTQVLFFSALQRQMTVSRSSTHTSLCSGRVLGEMLLQGYNRALASNTNQSRRGHLPVVFCVAPGPARRRLIYHFATVQFQTAPVTPLPGAPCEKKVRPSLPPVHHPDSHRTRIHPY